MRARATGVKSKTDIVDFDVGRQSVEGNTCQTLVNRSYESNTWKTALQPEDSAVYTISGCIETSTLCRGKDLITLIASSGIQGQLTLYSPSSW